MIVDFFQWYNTLTGFELILWTIALVSSLLFVLHSVFSLFFGGDHGDFDVADSDGDGGGVFTIRNMLVFFCMFGWTGLAAMRAGLHPLVVIFVAFAAGAGMVLLMYTLMRKTAKLKHDGTVQLKNAVNQIGETYLRIPATRGGMGKVQVQVQGRYMELDAMTDDATDIPTGKPIQVVNLLNNRILMVTSELTA